VPWRRVALRLLSLSDMPDTNEPDDVVSKKVTYEHVASSGTSRNVMIVIAVILVIALVIVGYIFMHLHR
jgi:hypothetical protein